MPKRQDDKFICVVCSSDLTRLSESGRNAHINRHFDAPAGVSGDDDVCMECGRTLADLDANRRARHLERCGAVLSYALLRRVATILRAHTVVLLHDAK